VNHEDKGSRTIAGPALMDRALFEAASAVRLRAHDRYSGFQVGVALRTAAGTVHTGCNVENASFPEGWCAETSAIGHMVASSDPGNGRRIVEVAVVANAIGGRPTTPCGGCRQRLAEFGNPDTPVHCYDPEGRGQTWSLGDLLPQSFALKDQP
jgi:cytidine deaminase